MKNATKKTSGIDNSALAALAAALGLAQAAESDGDDKAAAAEARRWYTDIPESEETFKRPVPDSLRKERESVASDKALGENQRNRLLASIDQEISDCENGGTSVKLQAMKPEKRTAKTRYPVRLVVTAQAGDKERSVMIKPHELILLLSHAKELTQYLRDHASNLRD